MRVLQRSLGARRTWRAWTAGTRSLRTCCSPKWSAPTLMRREAQTTCLNSQTTTATPQTWGDVSVCSPRLFDVLPGLYLSFSSHSQPIMVCRQCPGYKADVSPLLFPPASSWWLPALPEGGAKAAGEQPSTSSDVPSGDGEHHHPKFSLGHAVGL